MVNNFVFDLGGVLIDFKPEVYLEKLGYKEEEVKYFTEIVFYGEQWNKYNSSKLDANQTKNELIICYPEYANDIQKIFDSMDYHYILFEMKDTIEYLKELKNKGYHIYILSDLSRDSYVYNKQFEFFKYIDGGVYSFEINSIKPNKKNYEILLEKYNLNPKETIFIDDRLNNIKTANELGMIGILFKNLNEIKQEISVYIE